ncbi:MAG: winged helix-turn-helix transcriptional regulator, partial [Methanomassiliicoccaceae archaeon]|nr:winged helix-turn-helix transcriptional regulator [Methanomassiliicoccaceae archaeon]
DGVNDGVKLSKTEMEIIKSLRNNGHLTAQNLAEELGVYIRTIERGLKKLKDASIIERIGSDRSGEWKVLK